MRRPAVRRAGLRVRLDTLVGGCDAFGSARSAASRRAPTPERTVPRRRAVGERPRARPDGSRHALRVKLRAPVRAVVLATAGVRHRPRRALFVPETRPILQTFASNDQQADGDRLRGTGWAGAALEGHGPDDNAPVAPHRGDPDRRKAAADAAARPRGPTLNVIQFFIGSCVAAGAILAFFGIIAYLESPTRRALRRPEANIPSPSDLPAGRRCLDQTAATTAEGFGDRPYDLAAGAAKGQGAGGRHAEHIR